ncbi:hypothetical protein N7456_008025 [Penicillium angulare]|uniref:Uncharacterized protein n=1 Tax=Penicillium angulare TaxID=116970 RepID=A0A9W9K8Q2_9EURO|nr:hypothetical protein N7456_008025 [Penicillium angulare]
MLFTLCEEDHLSQNVDLGEKIDPLKVFRFTHIASYTRIKSSKPTIAVPGHPSLWSPLTEPKTLDRDRSEEDLPMEFGLEPLFRAVYMENRSFDMKAVSVLADNRVLRILLDFASNNKHRKLHEAWTLEAEVLGSHTVAIRQIHSGDRAKTGNSAHRGMAFGRNFERANAKEMIEDGFQHQRIITYQLGKLNVLTRYEADGFIDNDPSSRDKPTTPLRLGEARTSSSGLQILDHGQKVSPESIIEIKTRGASSGHQFGKVAAQLWFSRVTNLALATHQKGKFNPPKLRDVTGALKKWQNPNTENLNKLACGLDRLALVLRKVPKFKRVMMYFGLRSVTINSNEGKIDWMLPGDIYRMEWGEHPGDPESAHGNELFEQISSIEISYSKLFSLP